MKYADECHLFKEYPSGTVFYRARKNKEGESLSSVDDMGPPPVENATKHNRMSPAGIVMFYVSMKPKTAIAEIADGPGTYTVAIYETLKTITLLDLSKLEKAPGFFYPLPDSAEYNPIPALRFINALKAQISLPIAKDGAESIEYVPTQIVTEFIRHKELSGSRAASGIIYSSSVDPTGYSAVLFATQKDCLGTTAFRRLLHVFQNPSFRLTRIRKYRHLRNGTIQDSSG